MQRITALWNKGLVGKLIIGGVALLLACCVIGVLAPRTRPPASTAQPTAQVAALAPTATPAPPTVVPTAIRTIVPTRAPEPTQASEPSTTSVPTTEPQTAPTAAPPQASAARPASGDNPDGVPGQGGDCPADYPIKGNINSKGEKIYHSPGGQFYDRTDPERCFATAADAQAAGFRPSQR